jgi:hypothetical protein
MMKDTKALHVHFQNTQEEVKEQPARVEYDSSVTLEQSIEQFVQKKRLELERAVAEKTVAPEKFVEEKKQALPPPRAIFTTTHLSDKDLPTKPKRKRKRSRKNKDVVAQVEEPPVEAIEPAFSVTRLPSLGDHVGFSSLAIMEDCTPGEKWQV